MKLGKFSLILALIMDCSIYRSIAKGFAVFALASRGPFLNLWIAVLTPWNGHRIVTISDSNLYFKLLSLPYKAQKSKLPHLNALKEGNAM